MRRPAPARTATMLAALTALTAMAALLLGGCGIPDSTGVKVLGNGQSADPAQDLDSPPPRPVTRSSTNDVAIFISNYLKAAAGDPDGAVQRAKDFMDPSFAATFKPSWWCGRPSSP